MSISPTQMIQQGSRAESPAVPKHTVQVPVPAAKSQDSTVDSSVPQPPVSSTSKLTTDVRIDDHHRVYYEVVNDHTGDVVCEIPSEVIRKLRENLLVPLDGTATGLLVDEKS